MCVQLSYSFNFMVMSSSLFLGQGGMGRGLGYSGWGVEGGVATKNGGNPTIPISTCLRSDHCPSVLSKNTCNSVTAGFNLDLLTYHQHYQQDETVKEKDIFHYVQCRIYIIYRFNQPIRLEAFGYHASHNNIMYLYLLREKKKLLWNPVNPVIAFLMRWPYSVFLYFRNN